MRREGIRMNIEILNSKEISDFKQGDERIFKKVFDHYYPALLLFVAKLTGSREEAEDISLRAFQALFNRCHAFETEINMKAFLYICGRNSSLNYIKSEQHKREQLRQFATRMADDTLLEFEFGIKQGVVAAIYNAIEELPEECRKVFKKLYFEEKAPAEIAEELHLKVSTVYNQKSRALNALRMKFSENAMVVFWLLLPFSHSMH
ncbi:RNA polymerase sigma factor [Niastella sp. OAS944]|uniref:RNA polymerase sigma factor n=2 Tax=Niastella sp. OAS944 TaxID=2664089 RepID=UPI0035C80BDE